MLIIKTNNFRGNLSSISAKTATLLPAILQQMCTTFSFANPGQIWRTHGKSYIPDDATRGQVQCYFCIRNIGEFTPKIIHLYHLKISLDQYISGSKHPTNDLFSFEDRSTGQIRSKTCAPKETDFGVSLAVEIMMYLFTTVPHPHGRSASFFKIK